MAAKLSDLATGFRPEILCSGVVPPEDGQVMPEICQDIEHQ
jgi:hypothetical protein